MASKDRSRAEMEDAIRRREEKELREARARYRVKYGETGARKIQGYLDGKKALEDRLRAQAQAGPSRWLEFDCKGACFQAGGIDTAREIIRQKYPDDQARALRALDIAWELYDYPTRPENREALLLIQADQADMIERGWREDARLERLYGGGAGED